MDLKNIADLENYLDTHGDSRLGILLADMYLQAGNLQEAVDRCRQEITQNPRSALAYYLLAQIEMKLNRQENALEYLKQTVALDSGFLEAYYQLVAVGQKTLPPGAIKSCYLKIMELNPLDEDTGQAAHKIAEKPDPDFFKAINLPALPEVDMVAQKPAAEPVEIEELESLPQELGVEIQQEQESKPESEFETGEPAESLLLGEEEAHLGPMEPEEAEPEPEPDLEQFKVTESPQAAPASEPFLKQADNTKKVTQPEVPPLSSSALKLSEMFDKMKSKPLAEIQKEDWSLPVVGATNFEKPLPQEKGADQPEIEKKMASAGETGAEQPTKSAAVSRKKASGTTGKAIPSVKQGKPEVMEEYSKEVEQGKVEIKIPVPTFTLVEVFKKQRLYDEALQLLDVLEKRSKDQEKIALARQEIQELKLKEDLG